MKSHSSNGASSPALPFSPLAPGSILGSRVASRYEVDLYGRPRILSPLEVTLHALAWPIMLGVVTGFGIAIGVVAIHSTSTLPPQEKAGLSQMESLEAAL